MKSKNNHSKKLWFTSMITAVMLITGIVLSSAVQPETITISNEVLHKKLQSDGTYKYKFVIDISFPNPSDIRNSNTGKVIDGTYSIKLNRTDGDSTHLTGYVAMDYMSIGKAMFVETTIFDSAGGKPLVTSRAISIKDAVED